LIGVEARFVIRVEEAAVEIIGAGLGSDVDLCTVEATILGVVTIGDNFYAFDGIF
jgi:4-diphosphocytidyl-2C-methyl-D-erythritol kinase